MLTAVDRLDLRAFHQSGGPQVRLTSALSDARFAKLSPDFESAGRVCQRPYGLTQHAQTQRRFVGGSLDAVVDRLNPVLRGWAGYFRHGNSSKKFAILNSYVHERVGSQRVCRVRLSQGAFGIVSASPLFFLAAKYPQEQGAPVTGSYTDGPEWGQQSYTNMFASDLGSVHPSYPVNTLEGKILRQFGGTVLGSYGYSISPSSSREAGQEVKSFEHAGGKLGVLDTSVPFGGMNFTSAALVAKQQHVNALFPTMIDASDFALATALKQAGVQLKPVVFATGYAPDVVNSPTWSYLQGDEFLSIYRPFSLPDAGTEQMAAALEKYQHFSKSQFPTLFQYETWAGADLMIRRLQMAGANPTRAAVIKDLRSIKSYTANGLLPKPIDYATNFGHDPAEQCVWVLRAEKSGFVPASSQPVCGTDIKGTSSASSS